MARGSVLFFIADKIQCWGETYKDPWHDAIQSEVGIRKRIRRHEGLFALEYVNGADLPVVECDSVNNRTRRGKEARFVVITQRCDDIKPLHSSTLH